MSDMAPQYFNAFVSANNCPSTKRLLCSWHVDKAWQTELREKIGNNEVEAEVYLKLKTIQQITNENLFQSSLQLFVDQITSSNITESFGQYIVNHLVDNKRDWDIVFELVSESIPTCLLMVEAFHHHTLKYNYLKKKHNKRVDVLLLNLIKFSRDQVFERLIRLTKGKDTARQTMMHERHLASERLSFASITSEGKQSGEDKDELEYEKFNVLSEVSKDKSYTVTKTGDACVVNRCVMKCHQCSVCAHVFQCICTDFLIHATCCKHVHLVKRFIDIRDGCPSKQSDQASTNKAEIEEAFNHVKDDKPNRFKEYETYMQKLSTKLDFLRSELNSCTNNDIEAIKHLDKDLAASTNTFLSMKKNTNIAKIELKENFPPNKNIEVQQKFRSITKRKKKSRVRLAKPTREEQDGIADQLVRSGDEKILKLLGVNQEIPFSPTNISNEVLSYDSDLIFQTLKKNVDGKMVVKVLDGLKDLHMNWLCSFCDISKYADMIECDQCGCWNHWECVCPGETNLPVPTPSPWICADCVEQSGIIVFPVFHYRKTIKN